MDIIYYQELKKLINYVTYQSNFSNPIYFLFNISFINKLFFYYQIMEVSSNNGGCYLIIKLIGYIIIFISMFHDITFKFEYISYDTFNHINYISLIKDCMIRKRQELVWY